MIKQIENVDQIARLTLRKVKTISFYDWCVINNRQDLLERWDYDLNPYTPEVVSYQSNKKMYFKCPDKKHCSSKFKLQAIVRDNNQCVCKLCKLEHDSFGRWCEDNNKSILDLWDYELNDKSPYEILRSSKVKIWFKCPRGIHQSEQKIIGNIYIRGHISPCNKCNSFGQYLVDLYGENAINDIWDFEKNNKDPFTIARSARQQVWLKCLKNNNHSSYLVWCSNYLKRQECPYCAYERETSKLQEIVREYVRQKYSYNILHEYNCNIRAINPKTNHILPYDNQVLLDDNVSLIIEVHGIQHYDKLYYATLMAERNNTTPEFELAEIQWRDEYKKNYAISQGYYYLAIPYWTEKDESYKNLIDDKIQEILAIQN